MNERQDGIDDLFEIIEFALGCQGFKIMDGDGDTAVIRNPVTDTDYQIRIEEVAG